ncbi:MAG: hypothetical protein MK052_11785, partial [Alphaproteobacteria bacterium]|nr:hypothetical protein [Alphaproteobacteria bacterium]
SVQRRAQREIDGLLSYCNIRIKSNGGVVTAMSECVSEFPDNPVFTGSFVNFTGKSALCILSNQENSCITAAFP